jgi:PAS domain S-box-containing protein
MERRQHDRFERAGRRQSDGRPPGADNRRVLLVGPDEAWRLLTAYVFEEAGYAVYAAADHRQGVAYTTRLLPDVVVVQMEAPDTLDTLARLSEASRTYDIPVVVLTSSLQSTEARRARAAGGVTLLAHPADVDVFVGEVDALIAAAPRAQRTLKRRLLDLQELARFYTPNAEGRTRLRHLIDRLQVALFAVDEQGHCIAASQGATMLTGYSRLQLLTCSMVQAGFAGGHVAHERWRSFLANRQYTGTTTITNRAGEDVTVHAAAVAEVMPGVHVAAFAAACILAQRPNGRNRRRVSNGYVPCARR